MMYNQIECPICGNTTTAKSVEEPQKCRWCRRLFKVTLSKRKQGKKWIWSAEAVDFEENNEVQSNIRNMTDYSDRDIYG